MGYDLNRFENIQEIPNNLRCLICGLVLQDPLQSASCVPPHNFCNACITIHLKTTNHCPHYDEDSISVKSDKKKSPLRKMSFKKLIGKSPKEKSYPPLKLSDLIKLPDNQLNELNNLKLNCNFHSSSCTEKLKLIDLNDHLKTCKFIDEPQQSTNVNTVENKQNLVETNLLESDQQEINSQILEQQQKEIIDSGELRESLEEDMDKQRKKRKDSENKSVNGEMKIVSEEEAGSDDFVVIPKNSTQTTGSSSTKSSESVKTNSDSAVNLISSESKENLNKQENDDTVGKKKKKKKKKNGQKKPDADAVSLDTASSKDVESGNNTDKTQSKESLVESEEIRRALKDAEAKGETLRLFNTQLLGQIKQLKDEKEELNKQLQIQLNTGKVDELKNKLSQLEKEKQLQAQRIKQLINSNDNMHNLIVTLKENQNQLKQKYDSTLNDVTRITEFIKNCKQTV